MPGSFVSLYCHVVFSTKDRARLIDDELQPRLFQYMGGTLRKLGGSLIAAGGVPDHVHLLVSMGKQESVSDMLRDIKANSSGWIHETFPDRRSFAWQSGYGAFSVSYSQIEVVRGYLAKQQEHHRVKTFQEEFVALLKKHHIEFDEQHIWD